MLIILVRKWNKNKFKSYKFYFPKQYVKRNYYGFIINKIFSRSFFPSREKDSGNFIIVSHKSFKQS